MGAPKQKWTEEEESALKAGVVKHGAGKWCTILKDPEFSSILCSRSNVDLKDKWRNLSVTARGWGSREKGRITLKRSRRISKDDGSPLALSTMVEDPNDEVLNAEPLSVSSGTLEIAGLKKSASKLENLILEAIKNLKAANGSDKAAIAMYIEEHYWPPPDFKQWLSAKLKALTASGKLTKVKRKYRIARSSPFSRGRSSKMLLEGKQREPPGLDKNDFKLLTKSQIKSELAQLTNMTAQEAADAAAKAIAVAEAATAEAEAAARKAEAAEADAEAAQAFADAAKLALKNRNAANLMVRI